MNAQQLKNSILQEAIEGRLVPQDPNDEPASVLLDKIRKEKAKLVKEGKLKKKDLVETPVSEDEIPFEIPDSWEWCKLGTIASLLGGFAFKSHEYTSAGSRVIRISDITEEGFVDKNIVRYPYNEKLNTYVIQEGDILMAMTGGTVGKSLYVKVLPEKKMLLNQRVANIRAILVFTDYIDYVIKSQHIQSIITDAKNSTNDNISMGDIYNFPIPLPPLAEQKRIVAKIEELMPKVEAYGKAQESLDKLNEELPEKLKKSILQEAIEGRLVPQDPNDEPASVLLDKIRKEKARLVKEGKLKKKDLEETPIEEDEIPFKIPESWEWCRISTVLNILDSQRKPVTKSDREAGIYPYCGANGILDYVKDYIFDGKFVLVGEDGSVVTKYGNPVVNKIEGRIWVNNHAHILQEFGNLGYQDFIYYALMNTDISVFIHGFMPKYSQGDLRKTLIPLPPLAEQHRIVQKIEQLMNEIDKLKV